MRIVVRSQDPRQAREAQTLLAAAGVEAMALPGPYRLAPDGEDIAIVRGEDAEALARAAWAAAAPPLAVFLALTHAHPRPLATSAEDVFSGALALDSSPKLLAGQVEAGIRVAVTEDERVRRAASAAALGTPTPKPLEARRLKALYIGAPSPFFLSLERAIVEQNGSLAAAFSSYTGFDHLHDEAFDAVVLNGAQDSATAVALCAALRRNTTLHHLPTMVLTAPGDNATVEAAIERGASATASASETCGPSLGWLFEAIRRESRRRVAEHALRALRDLMGDARTGLFRRAPFDAHLARLASDHHRSGRPLALVALRVLPAFGASQPGAEAWRRGFSEIASLAARLMREADCGAALSGDVIALTMPTSDLAAARRTAERIASVAECTAFATGDNGAGPLVFERSAVELQPGESGAGLLARALRVIEAESLSA